MKNASTIIIAAAVSLFLTTGVFAQKKESLAIFPFTGDTVEHGDGLASRLAIQPAFDEAFRSIIPHTRSSIAAMASQRRYQLGSGMTSPDVIFKLGVDLSASHVVAGHITKLNNRKLAVISILDVESLQQIAGYYRDFDSIEEIDNLIPEIARRLADSVKRGKSGLPGLAVPAFNISKDVNQNDAMALAQILACDLANGNKYAVLPQTGSLDTVIAEYNRQMSDETDKSGVKRQGAGINAEYVLAGSVTRVGKNSSFIALILKFDRNRIDAAEKKYTDLTDGITLIPILAARLNAEKIQVNSDADMRSAIGKINAAPAGYFLITLTDDVSLEGTEIERQGKGRKTVIIEGDHKRRTITNISNDQFTRLFEIKDGVTLILENNITLNCNSKNGVLVAKGGRLNMTEGAVISGSGYGGVEVLDGAFRMSGGTISGNSAGKGGGVWVGEKATFTMTGGTISGNSADCGGGVCVEGENATFTMSGGTISGNKAEEYGGGGVFVGDGGTFTMTGGTISGNKAEYGGGVYVTESSTFTMTGGEIKGNKADGVCGGVAVYSSGTFTMTGGIISGNKADRANGGVAVGKGSTFTMTGGTISGNSADYGGGVVVGTGSTFTMTGGTISGNKAEYGGGVYVTESSTFTKTGGNIDATNKAKGKGNVAAYWPDANNMWIRSKAAGPAVNMDSRERNGGWEADIYIPQPEAE